MTGLAASSGVDGPAIEVVEMSPPRVGTFARAQVDLGAGASEPWGELRAIAAFAPLLSALVPAKSRLLDLELRCVAPSALRGKLSYSVRVASVDVSASVPTLRVGLVVASGHRVCLCGQAVLVREAAPNPRVTTPGATRGLTAASEAKPAGSQETREHG